MPPKIKLYSIRRPGCDATPEEVLIFGLNREVQQHSHSDHRPVVGIA